MSGDQVRARHDEVLAFCLETPEHKLWEQADRFWRRLAEHPKEFPDTMFGALVDDIGTLMPAVDECAICKAGKCKKWGCRDPESCPCDHKRTRAVA